MAVCEMLVQVLGFGQGVMTESHIKNSDGRTVPPTQRIKTLQLAEDDGELAL